MSLKSINSNNSFLSNNSGVSNQEKRFGRSPQNAGLKENVSPSNKRLNVNNVILKIENIIKNYN